MPQLIIDPDDVTIAPGEIVLKHTESGGYFCLGFGPSAEFLRKVDEDPGFGTVLDEAEASLNKRRSSLAHTEDPFLRRLRTAISVTKDFDPEQPRDEQGRWTSVGDGGVASSIADSLIAPERFAPALQQFATRALAAASAIATDVGTAVSEATEIGTAGAVAATAALSLGVLAISTTSTGASTAGSVPSAPDLGYSLDRDTDVLTLTRTNADGSKDTVFEGHPGPDGLFRNQAGDVVGRRLDGSIVIDAGAIPGYRAVSSAQARSDEDEDASTRTGAIAANDNDPKLCPAPEDDFPGWEDHSDRSLLYQSQITGLPPGLAINFNGESFDGCRESDGTLLEAKGAGFLWAMTSQTDWRPFYKGVRDMMNQAWAQNQAAAAAGRRVEWHFAEEPVANFFRMKFEQARLTNIAVFYTPPMWRKLA